MALAATRFMLKKGEVALSWDSISAPVPEGADFHAWNLEDGAALAEVVESFEPQLVLCLAETGDGVPLLENAREYCEEFERCYYASVRCVKATISHLCAQGRGTLIFGSLAEGLACGGDLSPAAALDWALAALGESLSAELKGSAVKVQVLRGNGSSEKDLFRGITEALKSDSVDIYPQLQGRLQHMSRRLAPALISSIVKGPFEDASFDTVLVTGASSGLGQRLARKYATRTRRLCITARRAELLDALKVEIESTTDCVVESISADLTRREDIDVLVDRVGEVDAIINCAGRHLISSVKETELETYRDFFALNFLGPAYLIGRMAKASTRLNKVVTILSTSAIRGRRQRSTYAGTKAALWALTRGLRIHTEGRMQVLEVLPSTFGPDPSYSGNRRKGRTPSTDEVCEIVFSAERKGRSYAYAPAEVRLFLSLAAFSPKLFARVFR